MLSVRFHGGLQNSSLQGSVGEWKSEDSSNFIDQIKGSHPANILKKGWLEAFLQCQIYPGLKAVLKLDAVRCLH